MAQTRSGGTAKDKPPKTTKRKPTGRKEPPRKKEEPDTPMPSIEDEVAASTYAQASEVSQAPTTRRTRSVSAQATSMNQPSNPPQSRYPLRTTSRSVSPKQKAAAITKRVAKRSREEDEEDIHEDEATQSKAKRSRSDNTTATTTATKSRPRGGSGSNRGRGTARRGGGAHQHQLQPIQEASPAKPKQTPTRESDSLTAILSAPPSHTTPTRTVASPRYTEPAGLSTSLTAPSPADQEDRSFNSLFSGGTLSTYVPSPRVSAPQAPTPQASTPQVSNQSPEAIEASNSLVAASPADQDRTFNSLFSGGTLSTYVPSPRPSSKSPELARTVPSHFESSASTTQTAPYKAPELAVTSKPMITYTQSPEHFAATYTRRLSPLKNDTLMQGYESLSDDDIPDYKPKDPEWREKKERFRNAWKYIDTGKIPTVSEETDMKQKQKQKKRMPSTSSTAVRKNTLRTVAEWATSGAGNKLPDAEQMISLLEQTKTQVPAAVASPQPESDAENPIDETTTTGTYAVPDDSDSDTADEVMSIDDEDTENAQPDHASTTHNESPQTPPPKIVSQEKVPGSWFRSAGKAVSSAMKFFGRGSQNGAETAATNPNQPEFTFTSPQKLPPQTPVPAEHGGRTSRKTRATERPQRFNNAMIPPERLIPRSERRQKKPYIPIERRGLISEERKAELQKIQEDRKRKQREEEEARLAEEDHNRTRVFRVPSPSTSSDDEDSEDEATSMSSKKPEASKSEGAGLSSESSSEVQSERATSRDEEKSVPTLQRPPEPMRDWEKDDAWGFTFTKNGQRYSKLWYNPPDHPYLIKFNPPQSSRVQGRQTPEVREWIAEHKAWRELCLRINDNAATQAEIDEYNKMIKDHEEARAAAAEAAAAAAAAPPPPPRPSNAQLPVPSAPEIALAKATKYAPKTPSGLRNAERAYSSPVEPEVESVPEKRGSTELKVDADVLRLMANRNEKIPRIVIPMAEEKFVAGEAWLYNIFV